MDWLTGSWTDLAAVAGKAALMYVIALIGLRVAQRRTLAQWTIIDFATAVAVGAIIGRTAIAGGQSFATGAVALMTLVLAHLAASMLRFNPVLGRLTDYRVRVLVEHGHVRRGQLRRCGLTDRDLYAEMRMQGWFSLSGVAFVLYEARGGITIVPESSTDGPTAPHLVQAGIDNATGYRQPAATSGNDDGARS